jgi:hypothetical protein
MLITRAVLFPLSVSTVIIIIIIIIIIKLRALEC